MTDTERMIALADAADELLMALNDADRRWSVGDRLAYLSNAVYATREALTDVVVETKKMALEVARKASLATDTAGGTPQPRSYRAKITRATNEPSV